MDNVNNRGVLPFCPFPDIVFINEEAKGCISEEARDAIIASRNWYSCVLISCFTVTVAPSLKRHNFSSDSAVLIMCYFFSV